MKPLNLLPIPAFDDNYLWVLHDGSRALAVDPGDPAPVRAAHLRVARQRSELGQGLVHLCGGALKQATAATREQSVTTE